MTSPSSQAYSSTSSPPTDSQISSSTLPFPSINQPFSVKLDSTNYLIWKNQLLNVIIAQGLEEYLDGSIPMPSKFLNPHSTEINPNFSLWHRYNRLLMSWIYAFLSKPMLTQIVSYNTTYDIWNALAQIYSSTSMARLTELHTSLQSLKKGSLSISAYIQKLKSICNNLAAIGEPVTREDHLIYLLGGLGREYNPFVASVHNRADKPSIEEVHSILMSYDFRIESQNAVDQLDLAQVNLTHSTQSTPFKKNYRPNNSTHFSHNYRPYNSTHFSHNYRPPASSILGKPPNRPNQFPWKPPTNSPNPPPFTSSPKQHCQICAKPGHTAINCYHRTNLNYQPNFQPRNFNTYITPPPENSSSNYQTSSVPSDNSNWFLDSGATHHFTPDYNSMDLASPYQGSEHVMIGDGSSQQENPAPGTS